MNLVRALNINLILIIMYIIIKYRIIKFDESVIFCLLLVLLACLKHAAQVIKRSA